VVGRVRFWRHVEQRALLPFFSWRAYWGRCLGFWDLNSLSSAVSLTTEWVEPVVVKMLLAPPVCLFRIGWLFTT
jgi:hypothetical protein